MCTNNHTLFFCHHLGKKGAEHCKVRRDEHQAEIDRLEAEVKKLNLPRDSITLPVMPKIISTSSECYDGELVEVMSKELCDRCTAKKDKWERIERELADEERTQEILGVEIEVLLGGVGNQN